MKSPKILAIASLATVASSHGSEHKLEITIPQMDVSEYHRPYVSVWVENADKSQIKNILVWYQINKDTKKGEKWLKDMRKWWRTSGRKLEFPIDGVSSPTKPPGKHSVDITEALNDLPALKEGEYKLCVEAAREVGGRELIKVPFKWDGKALTAIAVAGSEELGEITLKTEEKPVNTSN